MRKRRDFVAALFVMALCGFTVFGIDLYKSYDYSRNARQATMEIADPTKKIVRFEDALNTRTLDVRYVGGDGDVVVPQKLLPKDVADRLIDGEKIPVTYLANNHQRVFYRSGSPPISWAWLIVGLAALITAFYALKLYKREHSGHVEI